MPLTDNAAHEALDGTTLNQARLHDGNPAGASNEVAGGSYAPKAATWAAAGSRKRDLSGSVTFDVPAGTTVYFWSAYDSGGPTQQAWGPLQGASAVDPVPFVVEADDDTLTAKGHGLSDNDVVTVLKAAEALPAGLTEGNIYYVISSTTDTLQLSTSEGGSAVDVTADGDGFVQKIVPETFGADGTYELTSAEVSVP